MGLLPRGLGALCATLCVAAALQLGPAPTAPLAPTAPPARAAVRRRALIGTLGLGAAVVAAAPRVALADMFPEGNATEFDAGAYFGLFSCEGWGQKRLPGSNTCIAKDAEPRPGQTIASPKNAP